MTTKIYLLILYYHNYFLIIFKDGVFLAIHVSGREELYSSLWQLQENGPAEQIGLNATLATVSG